MASELIYEKLTPVFRDVFEIDDLVVTADLTANRVPGWDSLANVRLFVAIEQEFGIRFSAPEMSGLKNVGELVSLIDKKRQRR
jgi:acyl carrier protein